MQNTSTAFHPQTDGQTERVNQEIEKYLWIFINHQQNDWMDWLPLVEFAHNNRIHSATGRTSFMVMYGQNMKALPDATNFVAQMHTIHKEMQEALERAAERMKMQYNKGKQPSNEYPIGSKVWLDATNLHLSRPKKKLDDKRVGLFKILKRTGTSAYKLKLLPHWKIHPHFNEKLLTPYIPPAFPNQEQPPTPSPDLIDDEEQYEIEEVLDSKSHRV
ncbi:uncharacterized protein ARMOST_02932 [Armillaria ostoyae]|uniref:Tf2-1-like SH3-like domain-containing protein n=1 Tax=Armillaria ostoyae TaxID=47428 RepID=A0A284QT04_ARMOS|nr:uncharacterized protein ARMOST_02932 [Armillaria ostoyae]